MSSVLPDLFLKVPTDFRRTSYQAPCKQGKHLTPKRALRNEKLEAFRWQSYNNT